MSAHKLFIFLMLCLLLNNCSEPVAWNGLEVGGLFPDLEFNLVNSDGENVDASAFRGKITLLYFGFTNCPGICPSTLSQLSIALDQLGPSTDSIQVLLVSVDPRRDTPEVMKQYTGAFGSWLHGLTGPEDKLHSLNNSFKVDFLAAPPIESGDYDVMHSNRVFAFDAQGRCRLLLSNTAETAAVVSDLKRLIKESGLVDKT